MCIWALTVACDGKGKQGPQSVSQEPWLAEHGKGLDVLTTRLDRVAERLSTAGSTGTEQPKTPKFDPAFVECESDYRDRDCNAKFVATKWLKNYQALDASTVPFQMSGSSITLALHILRDARSGKPIDKANQPFNDGIGYQARALRYLIVVDELTRVNPELLTDDSYAGGRVAIHAHVFDLHTASVLGTFSAVAQNNGDLYAFGKSSEAKTSVMQGNLNHAAEYAVRRQFHARWPEASLTTEGTDTPFGQLSQ